MAAMSSKPGAETSLTLIERVQKFPADGEAWDEFVRRYHPMIHAWCVKWGLQLPTRTTSRKTSWSSC